MDAFFTYIFSVLLSFLIAYGYPALFVVAFFAAALLPLPASTLLIAASAFSSLGYLHIGLVIIVTLAGNVLGDLTGYILLRTYGKNAFTAVGFSKVLHSKKFEALEDYFRHYPRTLIFFSRFMTEVNALVNFLAGISGVPFRTFIIFEVLGQSLYVFTYASAGYYLGSSWQDHVGALKWAAIGILTIGIIITVVQSNLYKRRATL